VSCYCLDEFTFLHAVNITQWNMGFVGYPSKDFRRNSKNRIFPRKYVS
jgi:hypothetical protein